MHVSYEANRFFLYIWNLQQSFRVPEENTALQLFCFCSKSPLAHCLQMRECGKDSLFFSSTQQIPGLWNVMRKAFSVGLRAKATGENRRDTQVLIKSCSIIFIKKLLGVSQTIHFLKKKTGHFLAFRGIYDTAFRCLIFPGHSNWPCLTTADGPSMPWLLTDRMEKATMQAEQNLVNIFKIMMFMHSHICTLVSSIFFLTFKMLEIEIRYKSLTPIVASVFSSNGNYYVRLKLSFFFWGGASHPAALRPYS